MLRRLSAGLSGRQAAIVIMVALASIILAAMLAMVFRRINGRM